MTWKPARGATQSYNRVREQARIQMEGRVTGTVIHELLPVISGFGLTTLREPSAGDIFFDLEGDPFAGEGGLWIASTSYRRIPAQPRNLVGSSEARIWSS